MPVRCVQYSHIFLHKLHYRYHIIIIPWILSNHGIIVHVRLCQVIVGNFLFPCS